MSSAPGAAVATEHDLTRFLPTDAWIFDLDNTLYPRHANLYVQVDDRIRAFVGRLLGLGPEGPIACRRTTIAAMARRCAAS